MKHFVIFLIRIYQWTISPVLLVAFGKGCRFTPTCSQYSVETINKFGLIKGGKLAAKRIFRCYPFSKGSFDPVPNEYI